MKEIPPSPYIYLYFQASYRPTVEDLYSKDFQIGDSTLKVDFLDTSGDDQVHPLLYTLQS